jgi:tetratricopeptide (TPR) repeat protein
LVRGVKITDYCDQNQLRTRERLVLFVQVCQAIQHAHQKGVIHRDIKPSNILVSLNDGVAVPKVIDFGIAKATQGRLTDHTYFTAFQQFIGTPAYMSPEQAVMTSLDIDTRSDIYSLGVLLYELLTGRTPFDTQDLMKGGLDEMRRTIQEKEPLRPSTRLSRMPDADLTTVANRRQTNAPKLIHTLQGDLDWIVMKALEKDRARRYETAIGIARDVQRYLAEEPVLARPPSRLYLFTKLVRRNKLAFAAAVAVALALLLGAAVSVWQAARAIRAEREQSQLRKEAEAESKEAKMEAKRAESAESLAKERLAEAEAISKFLTEVFQSPDPLRDGRTITVAELLGAAAKTLDTELSQQPARQAKLQSTLGLTYHALGLNREAIPLQEKVRDYYLATSGPEDPETIKAMSLLARSYGLAGRIEEAVKLKEQVLALLQKVSGPEHPDTLMAMNSLSVSYDEAGLRHKALMLREEVVALYRKVLGSENSDTIDAVHNLANSYDEADRKDEALKLREEVLEFRRRVLGPEHPATLKAMNNLALSYSKAGRKEEALKLREEVVAVRRKLLGPEHPDTLAAMHNLASSYGETGQREEALKLREEVLSLRRKVLGPEHPDTLIAMNNLAVSYYAEGRRDEALKLREEALSLYRKVSGPEHADTLLAMNNLAVSYYGAGRRDEALKLREELIPLYRKVLGPEHPDTLRAMNNLANSCESADRRDEAIKLREQVLAVSRKVNGPANPYTITAMQKLADSYAEAGRQQEAIALLQQHCELDPKDTDASLTLATWQTWFGKGADYEATRLHLVQQAEGTDQAGMAERAAKAACLRPSTNADLLANALRLAQRAVELGRTNSALPWYQLTLGLAQYRNGQNAAAEHSIDIAERTLGDHDDVEGIAHMFHAMILFRLERPEDARKLFTKAEMQMPPLPKDESQPSIDSRPFDHDLLIWWLSYKEAKSLLDQSAAKP